VPFIMLATYAMGRPSRSLNGGHTGDEDGPHPNRGTTRARRTPWPASNPRWTSWRSDGQWPRDGRAARSGHRAKSGPRMRTRVRTGIRNWHWCQRRGHHNSRK
jgi:hypothetical protein